MAQIIRAPRSSTWLWVLVAAAVLTQSGLNLFRPITSYKLLGLGADPVVVGLTTAAYALLPLVTALSALVPNTSALPSLPNPLSTIVRVVGACGGVRAVRYREIEDARELLLRLAESPPAPESRPTPPRSWTPSSPAAGGPAPAPDAPGAGGDPAAVGLAQWVEALENPEDPSQLLVLLPERLVVLAGIGPHLWHACRRAGSLPLPELAAAVERECGANPQAQVLTRRCAARLESLGVLRRGPAPAGGAVE